MAWVSIVDILYPIGSVYETTSSSSPADELGGVWELTNSGTKRIHVGSQVLDTGYNGSGNVSWTKCTGAYNYTLINQIFSNLTIPNDYHKEYRLSFIGTTGNSNYITLALNNIQTTDTGTWSGSSYKKIGVSDFFKESDIILETTLNYDSDGINLKYQVTGTSSSWQWWNAMIHGYLASDDIYYEWKRIL